MLNTGRVSCSCFRSAAGNLIRPHSPLVLRVNTNHDEDTDCARCEGVLGRRIYGSGANEENITSTIEEENRKIAVEFSEGIGNEGYLDLVDEHLADDWVGHNSAVPEPIGPDGLKEFASTLRTAFADLENTVEDVIAEGDMVAIRTRFTGTHEGEFMGIEPTGTEVEIQEFTIARLEDGKVVETRSQPDVMGMMLQLGVVEPPG